MLKGEAMTGFMAFLEMQKITKMWKCWSITHTILAF